MTLTHDGITFDIGHPTHCQCAACEMPAGLATGEAIKRARDDAQRTTYPDHVPIRLDSRRDSPP